MPHQGHAVHGREDQEQAALDFAGIVAGVVDPRPGAG